MGTPIDGADSRTGGSLATDKGGGQVEMVLGDAEGMEHDID